MAVGDYNLNGHTPGLSETLSAGQWTARSVPSPAHGVNVFANEVSCASAASCLFVGAHWAGRQGPDANLAEAWNGSAWRIVTANGPAGTASSGLDDVACPTAGFCLAVGWAGSANHFQNTAYTWTSGTTWRQITVPRPRRARNSEIGAVSCFSQWNCMAVGNYASAAGRNLGFAARWHDGRWTLMTTPAIRAQRVSYFQGVSCPAANRCVAVGDSEQYYTRSRYYYHAFAEIWNGGAWHLSTLRRQPSYFIGVSCPARNHCFASGSTYPKAINVAYPLIETWNGQTWTTQHPARTPAPQPGDDFQHISCATQARCEAVGYRYNPAIPNSYDHTLAERWNGHHWTTQTTANP